MDAVTFLLACLQAVAPTLAACAAWKQSRSNYRAMNSRLDQLILQAQEQSYARGYKDAAHDKSDEVPSKERS